MSDAAQLIVAKLGFYGAVAILIYLIYYEIISARNKRQSAERELGEEKNENMVKNLDPNALVDLVNEDDSSSGPESSTPPKK